MRVKARHPADRRSALEKLAKLDKEPAATQSLFLEGLRDSTDFVRAKASVGLLRQGWRPTRAQEQSMFAAALVDEFCDLLPGSIATTFYRLRRDLRYHIPEITKLFVSHDLLRYDFSGTDLDAIRNGLRELGDSSVDPLIRKLITALDRIGTVVKARSVCPQYIADCSADMHSMFFEDVVIAHRVAAVLTDIGAASCGQVSGTISRDRARSGGDLRYCEREQCQPARASGRVCAT